MKKIKLIVFLILLIFLLSKWEIDNLDNKNKAELVEEYIVNTEINNEYIGYIMFSKDKIKCLIKEGIGEKVLKDNFIGHISNSSWLDDEYGNIILAGHNVKTAFANLHLMEKGELITLCNSNLCNLFKIIDIKEINILKPNFFYESSKDKLLTLITCTNNKEKRLIITAKKV